MTEKSNSANNIQNVISSDKSSTYLNLKSSYDNNLKATANKNGLNNTFYKKNNSFSTDSEYNMNIYKDGVNMSIGGGSGDTGQNCHRTRTYMKSFSNEYSLKNKILQTLIERKFATVVKMDQEN